MITIAKARRVLGKSAENLPDEYIEKLLSQMYQMTEVMFEHFGFIRYPDIDNADRNTKLDIESH